MKTAVMSQAELHASLRQFVYVETRLLDEGRYEQWYELFDEDGVYWVPASEDAGETAGQTRTDRDAQASLALENRMLLKLRIMRMQHAQAHSLHPKVRGLHVIQRPEVLERKALNGSLDLPDDVYAVACNMLYMERQGERQITLGGTLRYLLRRHGAACGNSGNAGWRIAEKRVMLLGCDGFLPAIQLFI